MAAAIATLSSTAVAAAAAYKKAYGYVVSVKAAKRKASLEVMVHSASEMRAFNSLCVEIAKHLGFKNLKELHEYTGDPEISLKLLLAHYRRISVMVDFSNSGKAILTGPKENAALNDPNKELR